jgi:hypothetical protein
MNENYTIFYPIFQYKKYLKVLERYVKHLNIKTEGEMYVLQHILNRDLNRDLILISIETIKAERGLITVRCRTRSGSYMFSVADIDTDGWTEGMDLEAKKSYVSRDLYHKMD